MKKYTEQELSELKKHEIRTIEDLLNVATSENFDRLMRDFILFAHHAVQIKEMLENEQIESVGFDWIDDGKNEIKLFKLNGKEIKIKQQATQP